MGQFLGTTNDTFLLASNWLSGILPVPGENIQISADCKLYANNANVYGTLLIDATKTFDIQTYNFNAGVTTANGILKIGNSANTGLTISGITWNSGGKRNWQTGSKVICNGNWIEPDENISANNFMGTITLTGTGNISKPFSVNCFYDVLFDTGSSYTITGKSWITGNDSNSTIINGTLNLTEYLVLGASETGSLTVNSTADITGTSILYFAIKPNATLTNNRATAFSFTGNVVAANINIELLLPSWDFSNSNIYLSQTVGSSGAIRTLSAGTLKCINFYVSNSANFDITVNNTNNPNIIASGNINLHAGTGTYNTIYTKGTGTYTLIGTSGTQTIDYNNQNIEALIVNSSGATKNFIANFTTLSFTLTDGIVNLFTGMTQMTTTNININGGIFYDLAKTIIVNGDISIANIDGILTSTGIWKKYNNGNIENLRPLNKIKQFESYNNILTLTNYFRASKIILDTVTITSGEKLVCEHSDTDNPLELIGACDINCKVDIVLIANVNQQAININNTLSLNYTNTYTLTMTGNLTAPTVQIFGSGTSIDYSTSAKLNMNGNNLNCTDLKLGGPDVANYKGSIIFGSGTHTITNILIRGILTEGYITGLTGTLNLSGNIDLTRIIYTPLTGQINLIGGSSNIDFQNKSVDKVNINSTGIKSIVSDFITFALSGVLGTLSSSVSGTQRTITATNTGVCSNMTFKDIKMNANNKINAKDNCVNNGNNQGIVFVDVVE